MLISQLQLACKMRWWYPGIGLSFSEEHTDIFVSEIGFFLSCFIVFRPDETGCITLGHSYNITASHVLPVRVQRIDSKENGQTFNFTGLLRRADLAKDTALEISEFLSSSAD